MKLEFLPVLYKILGKYLALKDCERTYLGVVGLCGNKYQFISYIFLILFLLLARESQPFLHIWRSKSKDIGFYPKGWGNHGRAWES